MPELTLFNCYNCHHDLTDDQWKKRSYGGHPGELKLNLSSLHILQEALKALDAGASKEVGSAIAAVEDAFRKGSGNGSAAEAAKLFQGKVREITSKKTLDGKTLEALLKANLEFGATAKWLPYETAEQVAMGVASVLAQKSPDGRAFRDEVNGLFKSLGNQEQFDPDQFTAACEDFLKRI
jgi:hypothetical protein